MKITAAQKNLLISIAQAPRRSEYFTHGKNVATPLNPNHVDMRLSAMVEAGLLFEAEGAFHITKLGRSHLDQGNVAGMRTATLKYTPYKMGMCDPFNQPQRPGSDHSALKSKGYLC
jgi:hypothetical protein